jgi:hypothetical protein
MRGRSRTLASLLAEKLPRRRETRVATAAAAFTEACGWPLAREARLRAHTRDGVLVVEVRSRAWADQIEALAGPLCEKVRAILGPDAVSGLDVRVAAPPRDP